VIRHAEPVAPTGAAEENDRPLSVAGAEAARELAASLAHEPIAAVYSSPYPRALQTAAPTAAAHGLGVELVEDLRERLLSPHPLADWYAEVRRTWSDFDYALPAGESSRVAQSRAGRVIAHLAERHPDARIAAVSHGNLIALLLNARDPGVGFELWEAMPMPAVYEIVVPAQPA
jgi:2,3-bisphosphoglycerate-dependent phosphoglycerate mutase